MNKPSHWNMIVSIQTVRRLLQKRWHGFTNSSQTKHMAQRTLFATLGVLSLTAVIAYNVITSEAPFDPSDPTTIPQQSDVACVAPPLLTHSVAPHSTFVYRYYGAWDTQQQLCVDRAFTTWNTYLTPLDVEFVSYANKKNAGTDISVLLTPLPEKIGGAIPIVGRRPDGYMKNGAIYITTDSKTVSSCLGFYKVGLHEIGHLLGLGHPIDTQYEASIMNNMSATNDSQNAIPNAPTACDVNQVIAASKTPRSSVSSQ